MSLGDIASIAGVLLTAAGMFLFKRKGGKHSRALIHFCTLMLLIFAQIGGTKILGKAPIPEVTFGSLIFMLVVGIYWLARDEEP